MNKLPDNPVSRFNNNFAKSVNASIASKEKAYQSNTRDSGAAGAGAVLGNAIPMLFGGGARALQSLGDAASAGITKLLPDALPAWMTKTAANTASAATQGAAVSAVQPVANTSTTAGGQGAPNYWDQKGSQVVNGAAIGAAIPLGASVVGGVAGGVKNVFAPLVAPKSIVGPLVSRIVGNDPATLAALKNPPQYVPGSMPTTAQVVANPAAVQAEKALANNPAYKPLFDGISNANNDARVAVLNNIANKPAVGAPDPIQAAITARSDATQPMIDKLLNNPQTSQPIPLSAITQHLDALDSSSLGVDPIVNKSIGAIRGQLQKAASNTDVNAFTYTPSQLAALKPDEPYIRPDLLDGIRQNLKDTLRDNASNGVVGTKQEAALAPLADGIISAIDNANPGYRNYLATYAKTSVPINTMETGRSILDNVAGDSVGLNSSGVPQITFNRVNSQLAKVDKAKYPIDPAAQAALEGVQSDLQRATISNSLRSPGSDTDYNLQARGWLAGKIYGNDFTGKPAVATGLGGVLGAAGGSLLGGLGAAGGATVGAGIGNKIAQLGQSRVQNLFA